MNIWELPKEHYNWESPITKVYGDIHNEIIRQDEENCTFAIEQAIGYKVDKNELIKALQYDREQYDKGYRDGVKETFKAELEDIKAEIQDLDLGFVDEEFQAGIAYGIMKFNQILNKHIENLKGDAE